MPRYGPSGSAGDDTRRKRGQVLLLTLGLYLGLLHTPSGAWTVSVACVAARADDEEGGKGEHAESLRVERQPNGTPKPVDRCALTTRPITRRPEEELLVILISVSTEIVSR